MDDPYPDQINKKEAKTNGKSTESPPDPSLDADRWAESAQQGAQVPIQPAPNFEISPTNKLLAPGKEGTTWYIFR